MREEGGEKREKEDWKKDVKIQTQTKTSNAL